MKECRYCGSFYEDSLSSCPNCGGSKIVTAEEKVAEEKLYIKEIQNQENSVSVPADAKTNKSGIALVLGILAIAVVICIAIFGGNGTSSSGQTKAESNEAYEQGVSCYNSGDYENAIMMLSAVAENSKYYNEAQEMLATASTNYSADIISKANTYVEKAEYDVALSLLENALSILPEDTKLQDALNSTFNEYKALVRSTAIIESDAFAADGDYESAIYAINNALSQVGMDEELSAKLEVCKNEYRNILFIDAADALTSSGYEHAISILNDGLAVLSDDDLIMNKIEEYKTYAPIEIMDLETFSGDNSSTVKPVIDTFGNEYNHAYIVSTNYGTDEFSILLDGKYNTLSGVIVWSKEHKDNGGYYSLQFYDGDRLVYSTDPCSATSGPIEFSCSVRNISILTVKFESFSSDGPFNQNIVTLTVQK